TALARRRRGVIPAITALFVARCPQNNDRQPALPLLVSDSTDDRNASDATETRNAEYRMDAGPRGRERVAHRRADTDASAKPA
ncbi:hypothetical protein, partial [Burkholderia sp.]|uniref:hypothetical protein n=1 Tax=Burkholderia sp. TaxID=36773 RepID=UPI0025885B86